MFDFLTICTQSPKQNVIEVFPKFKITNSDDLMIRGGDFYAIWMEDRNLWSTDEQDVIRTVDQELDSYAAECRKRYGPETVVKVKYMWDSDSGVIDKWHKYCQKQCRDSFHMLDEQLIFSNTNVTKKDYASKRLTYPLEAGDYSAYDRLISTLYSEEERRKIEWAIGAIVSGDSKHIQKFMVFYGAAGTGKSTIINIIQKLFEGYFSVFSAKDLGSPSSAFALEPFKDNPLVAIQHDGDLSRIEDNTRLNSLVSHEIMTVNEKFKSTYSNRFKCFLIMGTNKPVKITDAKSGLIRRLIDVHPTGEKVKAHEYNKLVRQIDFELGAIAQHCLEVYEENPNAYDSYIPMSMMGATNDFYNFIVDQYFVFEKENSTTLKVAWEMYKNYCTDANVAFPLSKRAFKEELKNYFNDYEERHTDESTNERIRSYYSGFRIDRFENSDVPDEKPEEPTDQYVIDFKEQDSIFDQIGADFPAQYAIQKNEAPMKKWSAVTTTLQALDTHRLHYVKIPENHIVIDFDLKGEDGEKNFELNLREASKWPKTYAELSKSGKGIHLHYIYSGDVTQLNRLYDDDIEIKVFTGNSSLRRKLTKCNDLPIATISSGLPLIEKRKEEKKVLNLDAFQREKGIRTSIKKALAKEIHADTRSNVDFIAKILDEAYADGIPYDVTNMKSAIIAFAARSTNQSDYCLKRVNSLHYKSDEVADTVAYEEQFDKIVFYDVEVFPNLFLICFKIQGEGNPVIRLINPKPTDIEKLIKYKLVGFNCRKYDNHMIYACMIGYTPAQIYALSQRIITKGDRDAFFGEAYNLSYTDIYDYAAKKQSLKKWEIELGIHHLELGLPWDQPVPEDMWDKVATYCDADVEATESVFNATQGDFTARLILADLAGMTPNDTTNSLTTRIIFGKEKHPKLWYTDLATGKQYDGDNRLVVN